jgi:hypothetical protein
VAIAGTKSDKEKVSLYYLTGTSGMRDKVSVFMKFFLSPLKNL